MELNQGEAKPSDHLDGGSDKSEKKAEDVIQCESEMSNRDMVRGMLNGIVDTVVQGMFVTFIKFIGNFIE
jgi:hypothetical protein